jgi:hypothetical protein
MTVEEGNGWLPPYPDGRGDFLDTICGLELLITYIIPSAVAKRPPHWLK